VKAKPKPAGTWDFDGQYDPARRPFWLRLHLTTFSAGIFQWQVEAGGKGMKRGKVVERIRGSVSDPESVYCRARDRVNELNKS